MDATELISALVAIAKDPAAWEKRIAEMNEAAGNLRQSRELKKTTDASREAAAKDLETARYERDQAERTRRDVAAQSSANAARATELDGRERNLNAQIQGHEAELRNARANLAAREADLDAREKIAAHKLNEASKKLAAYDEAKHQAALKLAS